MKKNRIFSILFQNFLEKVIWKYKIIIQSLVPQHFSHKMKRCCGQTAFLQLSHRAAWTVAFGEYSQKWQRARFFVPGVLVYPCNLQCKPAFGEAIEPIELIEAVDGKFSRDEPKPNHGSYLVHFYRAVNVLASQYIVAQVIFQFQ